VKPFLYFADQAEPRGQMVRDGRRGNLSDFPTTTHPDLASVLADPVSRAAFDACVLDHPSPEALQANPHHALFADLLALRRDDRTIGLHRADLIDASVIGPWAVAFRFTSADPCDADAHRLLLVNLAGDLFPVCPSEPLLAPPSPDHRWDVLWYSEHPRYGGTGIPPLPDDQPFRLSGRCALLLSPAKRDSDAVIPAEPYFLRDPDIHPQVRRRIRFE
jgi:maltooligosyltrehalose trehalohydrolase